MSCPGYGYSDRRLSEVNFVEHAGGSDLIRSPIFTVTWPSREM
jgi:hypothetical protein